MKKQFKLRAKQILFAIRKFFGFLSKDEKSRMQKNTEIRTARTAHQNKMRNLVDAIHSLEVILTARPAGMDFETYRRLWKQQNAILKERLAGTLIYKACEIFEATNERGQKEWKRQPFPPYVRRAAVA